jgi:hypothetical protein
VNDFVAALQKKIQDWINKIDPLGSRTILSFIFKGIEKIDLLKAKEFALLASTPTYPQDEVVSYVGMALDTLISLKDIAIMGGILSSAMSLKKVPTTPIKVLRKIVSIAKTTYKTFTKTTEIEKKLEELEALLIVTETKTNMAEIATRLRQAQAKLQEIEPMVLDELKRDNELEYEDDDDELDDDDEFDDGEFDDDDEFENELNTLEDDGITENFARRLHELSTQSFESEYELDAEVNRALDAMENEFMVKRLRRKNKRGKGKGLFGKILSAGAKIVGKVVSKTPVGQLIKAGTSLVRGDVKGALGGLAKAAVGTLAPGVGTVATAAMDALGGGEEGEISRGGRKRRAMKRVARIARDTYREVADTLPEDFDHPLVANEVARKAVHKAMVKNGVRPPGSTGGDPQQRRVIHLRPGEKVVIIG